jgi:hypothetical protein
MADYVNPFGEPIKGAIPSQQVAVPGALQINVPADINSLFNPNLALTALQTYNSLNSAANQMFGIEAVWFRAVPQQRSKDVIFQEYTLSCVDDKPICVKVMIGPNGFPDSKYQFDLMGLEYEVPTQLEIDKKYWESMVGFGTAPQKKDIVYLPLPNKLYQVESSYLKRGFLEQETTWIINLRKYQTEASRREGDALKETIDKYTVGEAELFGEAIANNIEKLTDKKQMSPFNSTSQDKFKTLDSSLTLKILNYNLDIHGIIAAQSIYDMKSSGDFNAVHYLNSSDYITKSDDRAVTAWIMPRIIDKKEYEVKLIEAKNIGTITVPANYEITIGGAKRFVMNDTFIISRPGALNFYAKVIDDTDSVTGKYYCKIDTDVITYLKSVNSSWTSMKNYKMKIQEPITLIDGTDELLTHKLEVLVSANQYIKIIYGSQEHVISMDTRMLDNSWYGVVVNIGNTWGQYNVYVWKPSVSGTGDKLTKVFYKTIDFIPEEVAVSEYTLNRSDSYMTNIRLFKTTIEEEKQPFELLSYFSKDADQAIVLDSADLRFTAPYVSKQR